MLIEEGKVRVGSGGEGEGGREEGGEEEREGRGKEEGKKRDTGRGDESNKHTVGVAKITFLLYSRDAVFMTRIKIMISALFFYV